MNTNVNVWNAGIPRYEHWFVAPAKDNPYREIDAPLIAAAAHETHVNLDVAPALAFLCAIDAVALVCQGLIDVEIPGHGASPVSTFSMKPADKSAGKSITNKKLWGPLYDLQAEYLNNHDNELKLFEQEEVVWGAKLGALKQAMAKKIRLDECPAAEESALRAHMAIRPQSPRRGPFLLEDTTSAAFQRGVYLNGVSVMLGGAEGGTILLGDALDEPQKLNALSSGEEVRVDRRTAPSFTIRGARVSVGIACQPGVLKDYILSKRGKKAAATGLFARLLVCDATSYQRQATTSVTPKSWVACEKFHARLLELMRRTLMASHIDGFERQIIRFSVEAAALWGAVRGQIEALRGPNGMYEFAQDHAGRLPEIVARLAALIHFFEGKTGDIDVGSLEAAIHIAYRSSQDYLKIFVPPPREYMDAQLLDESFERFRVHGQVLLDRSYARAVCPNALRKEGRYDLALKILLQQGRVCYAYDMSGYLCLQIIPVQAVAPQQLAYGRVVNGQRCLL